MKRLTSYIILLFSTTITQGQNLVPNGDFEITGVIPCGWTLTAAEFNSATSGWTSPTTGTPDMHSTQVLPNCSNHHPNSTAFNTNGSQVPLSGDAFAGFYAYAMDNLPYREYLQGQLVSPMIPGNKYIVEIYVSLADQSQYASDQLGIGFTTNITNNTNFFALGLTPEILFSFVVSDSINWVLLKDTIIPTQPYEYFIIGNFFDELSTNIISVNPSAYWQRSYYYCDNVSITLDTTVNIPEINDGASFFVFPNPVKDNINITARTNATTEFFLYDVYSKKLLQKSFQNILEIQAEWLAAGLYFYEMRIKNKIVKKGTIIKVE